MNDKYLSFSLHGIQFLVPFRIRQFFLTWNTCNPSFGSNYLPKFHLLIPLLFQYPKHRTRYLIVNLPTTRSVTCSLEHQPEKNFLRILWKYLKESFLLLTAFPTVAPLTLVFLPSVVTAKLLYLICSQLITQSCSICLFWKYPRISGGWNRVMLFFPTFKFTKVEPALSVFLGNIEIYFGKFFQITILWNLCK